MICNEEDIYPAMKQLVEIEGLSVNAAAKFIHEDSGGQVTKNRAEMVYRRRTFSSSRDEPDNPPTLTESCSIEPKHEEVKEKSIDFNQTAVTYFLYLFADRRYKPLE